MLDRQTIKQTALSLGFNLCGVARAMPLKSERHRFEKWLSQGCGQGLDYLDRNMTMRFDPSLLLTNAASVIVCAVNYKNSFSLGYPPSVQAKTASYALAADYHVTIKNMLFELAKALGLSANGVEFRCTVDSAPVAEKSWAVRAGLGSIGRNSLLITPQYGSFVLLGELITTCLCESYDAPFVDDLCGGCRLCVSMCPNAAIADRAIDTRCCIARLTIERGATGANNLNGWMFGCDECQSRCPHNRHTPLSDNRAFEPLFDPLALTSEQRLQLLDQPDNWVVKNTPLARAAAHKKQKTD